MDACVTLEEVLVAASARCASLVPETSGYLTLAIGDATSRLPLRIDDRAILLTTEGAVTMARRGEVIPVPESTRQLRDALRRLLAVSSGTMPGLTTAARPRAETNRGADALVEELEAALIPVNRNAARRALARLARETLRARESGRLRRALRTASKLQPAQAPVDAAAPAPAASPAAVSAPRPHTVAAPPHEPAAPVAPAQERAFVQAPAPQPAPLEPPAQEPAPIEAQAEEPAPIEAQTEEPAPIEAQAEEPAPVEAQTEEPAPVEAQAEEPAPVEAQAEEPAAPRAPPPPADDITSTSPRIEVTLSRPAFLTPEPVLAQDALEAFLFQLSPEPPQLLEITLEPTPTAIGMAWIDVAEGAPPTLPERIPLEEELDVPTVLNVATALNPKPAFDPEPDRSPEPRIEPPQPLRPGPIASPLDHETLPWPVGLAMSQAAAPLTTALTVGATATDAPLAVLVASPEPPAAAPATVEEPASQLSGLDAIFQSTARKVASRPPESAGPLTRADELLASFVAQHDVDPTCRAAARAMKALAGLDLTPPPLSGGLALAPARDRAAPGRASPRPPAVASPRPSAVAPAERGQDAPPAPPSSPSPRALLASDASRARSRRPTIRFAVLVIALLCAVGAGLAMTLRPDLLAARAPPASAPSP